MGSGSDSDPVEGFISYNNEKAEGESILLPQYSSSASITKLYDSMYYDVENRNVIQLFGSEYTGTTDVSGTTLTSIDVIPVGGKTVSRFDVTTSLPNVDATKIKLAVPTAAYNSWIYPDSNVFSTLTPYQVVHIPHGKFSVLHVYDVVSKKHIMTYRKMITDAKTPEFSDSTVEIKAYSSQLLASTGGITAQVVLPTESSVGTNDINNVVFIKIKELYTDIDDIYQLTSRIFYDTYTGNLIVNVASTPENIAVLDVYGRQPDAAGNAVKLLSGVTEKIDAASDVLRTAIPIDPVGTTTLKSWIVADNIGKTTVLYIPSSVDSSTLVVLLNVDPKNADLLTIQDAVVFTAPVFTNSSSSPETATTTTSTAPNTSDVVITTKFTATRIPPIPFTTDVIPISTATAAPTATDVSGVSAAPTNEDELEKIIGDYYSRYWKNNNMPMDGNYSTDFLLKTQVIPPICPACPACPASNASVCQNCGGNGGEGSLNSTPGTNVALPVYGGGGGGTTGSGSSGSSNITASGIVSGTGNVANTAVTSAGGIANNAVSGVGSVANNAVSTTGSLAQGTVGVVGDVVEETINEFGDVTTGAIGVAGRVVNTTVGTMGDVIENSASTVNDLLGDPYNNVKRNLRENEMRRNSAPSSAYGNRQGNPMNTYGPPTPSRTPRTEDMGILQIILPITELAGHE
jgi:hypothetical protein